MKKNRFLTACTLMIFFNTVNAQNVGIGITAPKMPLHVAAADGDVLLLQSTNLMHYGVKTGMYFNIGGYYAGGIAAIGENNYDARLGFFTYANTSGTNGLSERMTIDNDGRVGINISSPAAALDINGSLIIRGGNPGQGKVLTSNMAGYASWEELPSKTHYAFSVRGVAGGGLNVLNRDVWNKVHFNSENYDPENLYTLSTGTPSSTFTVPVSGFYHFNTNVSWMYVSNNAYRRLMIRIVVLRNGTTFTLQQQGQNYFSAVLTEASSGVSSDARLLHGDQIWVEVLYSDLGNDAPALGGLSTGNELSVFSANLIYAD